MKTIGFIGLGLIGGSIARTIRKFHPDYRLLAFDKDRDALAEAVSLNVIDGICDIEDERLYNCDYLFLCAPVEFNVEYMEKIKDPRKGNRTWTRGKIYRRPSNGRLRAQRFFQFQ